MAYSQQNFFLQQQLSGHLKAEEDTGHFGNQWAKAGEADDKGVGDAGEIQWWW